MLPKQGIIYVDPNSVNDKQNELSENNALSENGSSQSKSEKVPTTDDSSKEKPHDDSKAAVLTGSEGEYRAAVDTIPEVQQEAQKETQKEEVKSEKKLDDVHDTTPNVLYECSSVFPFQLIPDKLTIDLHKVNIIIKTFPFIQNVQSIYINDIAQVDVTANIILAGVSIKDRFFADKEHLVNHLKKSDAYKARRIIQGLIVANRESIDLSKVHENDLAQKLEELGQAVGQAQIPASA
jgi:hypothetical protein